MEIHSLQGFANREECSNGHGRWWGGEGCRNRSSSAGPVLKGKTEAGTGENRENALGRDGLRSQEQGLKEQASRDPDGNMAHSSLIASAFLAQQEASWRGERG